MLGYIGLVSREPFNRSELLEVWWRQELFDQHVVIRVGKSNPAIDFQDVIRPVTNPHAERVTSTVTPIFILPTLYESLPAFYETTYGITSTWTPSERFYDKGGSYPAGSSVIHPPEMNHSPGSVGGCVALLMYEKAVRFVEPE